MALKVIRAVRLREAVLSGRSGSRDDAVGIEEGRQRIMTRAVRWYGDPGYIGSEYRDPCGRRLAGSDAFVPMGLVAFVEILDAARRVLRAAP